MDIKTFGLGSLCIGLGVVVSGGYYALSSLEKKNRKTYNSHKRRLEVKARSIPQSPREQGEKVSSDIGQQTEELEEWAKKPWLLRAFSAPKAPPAAKEIEMEELRVAKHVAAHW